MILFKINVWKPSVMRQVDVLPVEACFIVTIINYSFHKIWPLLSDLLIINK